MGKWEFLSIILESKVDNKLSSKVGKKGQNLIEFFNDNIV